jgi:hypothetical protein
MSQLRLLLTFFLLLILIGLSLAARTGAATRLALAQQAPPVPSWVSATAPAVVSQKAPASKIRSDPDSANPLWRDTNCPKATLPTSGSNKRRPAKKKLVSHLLSALVGSPRSHWNARAGI